MRLHGNARTCPHSRRLLVERVTCADWTVARAAAAAGISTRTAAKWLARYRCEGVVGLADRSSRPLRMPRRTPLERVEAIERLRRLRMTAAEIAECLAMALSTVSAILKRIGLGKRSRLEPLEPPNRYEHAQAGALLHLDVKKLVRIGRAGHRVTGRRQGMVKGIGWEYVHVCVDDASRLAFAELHDDERGEGAARFLARVVGELGARGVVAERVLTDNGACYRSAAFAQVCTRLGIRHLRTRPYRPRTNGKAERFIRTLIERWAYGAIYGSSAERAAALSPWIDFYNRRRPHGSLGHQTPAARLDALMAEQRV